jgi:hypothetical protein
MKLGISEIRQLRQSTVTLPLYFLLLVEIVVMG